MIVQYAHKILMRLKAIIQTGRFIKVCSFSEIAQTRAHLFVQNYLTNSGN